jgi:hypothetical protein
VGTKSRAYKATPHSILAMHPKSPYRMGGTFVKWVYWKDWAAANGILDKHGNPSVNKVKTLIKYHKIAATVRKAHWRSSGGSVIWVAPAYQEQLAWTAEDWQECHWELYSRSQSLKARKKRKR